MVEKVQSLSDTVLSVFSSSASAVSAWVEGTRSGASLDPVLGDLSTLLAADAAFLTRTESGEKKSRVISSCRGSRAGDATRTYSAPLFGILLAQNGAPAGIGSVHALDEVLAATHPRVLEWIAPSLASSGTRYGLGVVLDRHDRGLDVLEFHYAAEPSSFRRSVFSAIAGELANSWMRRLPGTGERRARLSQHKAASMPQSLAAQDILSAENPAGLSRSEFRICMMLREGYHLQDICARLGVQKTTARTHLSAIYAKTGMSGQIDLLRSLLTERRSA